MKRIVKIAAVVLAFAVFAACFSGCGTISFESPASSPASQAASKVNAEKKQVSQIHDNVDFTHPDLVIGDGDYSAMESFLGECESKKWDGKVIQVTGINEQRIKNCSVQERNAEGSGKGAPWELIGGTFPTEYPADNAKITVTGVLHYDESTWVRVLMVPKNRVVVER